MSDAKRYWLSTEGMREVGEGARDIQGAWVRAEDYDAIMAERDAMFRQLRIEQAGRDKETSYAEAFRAALASIAYQMSDDGFNSESAAVVRATAQGIAERALIKNQRHGADSPASQVSDPSTSASSAHGVTTPADSAPNDVRSEVAQSAPATNAPLTERLKLVPVDPTDAMVDAACRDVGLCDGDAKDEELRQEYRVAYRAMVGDAPEAMRHQMRRLPSEAQDALRWRWWRANHMGVGRGESGDWTCWVELPCVPFRSKTTDPDELTDELIARFPLDGSIPPEIGASPLMPERNNLATHDTVLRPARSCPKCGASNDAVGEVGSGCWTRGCDGQIVSNLTHPSQGGLK